MDGLWLGSYWLDTRINSLAAAVSAASIAAVSCCTEDSRNKPPGMVDEVECKKCKDGDCSC